MGYKKEEYIWGILRIAIGLIFLWAFFDKLIGLGFTTCNLETGINVMCDAAWINGGSPTTGFLSFAAYGPLQAFYNGLAGNVFIDWIFMIGLLGIGLGLTFGFLVNLSSIASALMLFLMWTALLPPEHHPFLDDHIIYAIVSIGFIFSRAGRFIGIGNWWSNLSFVKRYKWLE